MILAQRLTRVDAIIFISEGKKSHNVGQKLTY